MYKKVGLSRIRSARRDYIEKFWLDFFEIIERDFVFSDADFETAYSLGRKFLTSTNGYCIFRYLDVGQHVDLVENQNCDCLILLSIREKGKRACSVENYVAEVLASKYKTVKIINFFLYLDEEKKREAELEKLAKLFTDDTEKIERIKHIWPKEYVDTNVYQSKYDPSKINLYILGDIYELINPRMMNSKYIDSLCEKFNCNILTPTDFEPSSHLGYKKAIKKLNEYKPLFSGKFEHYWRDVKRIHIVDTLLSQRNNIDGVLLVSDIWCEMFKEEVPTIISIIKELNIPYYNLVFNMDSLSTIDTIFDSFTEMLWERKMNHENCRG